ncbi:glycoside hydrolase family 64 protein [Micromonospora sp. NPDC049679]|uniref:glycoside hydrolase family 64 protein n=1 Tax=Micromonospora sp. NPDC049679 TaxID=3155920 RepID=UPI003401BBAE
MLTRRTLLGGALAVTAGAPLVASAFLSRADAATALPMTVVNNTRRFANSQIWMYVVGVDPTGRQGYVKNGGVFSPCQLSDNGPDGFADLSVPLSGNGDTSLSLPNMSGRVYFSIGQKLKFKVVSDGAGRPALQYPAGWVASDPNYAVLHDCVEFTFNGAGMFCNTTAVDMFSIPLAIRLAGNSTQTTGALVSGGRDRIFDAIAAQPDFARLVVGDRLRVIAPGHGIDSGLFSPTYYDGYVNEVWARYAGTDLRVTTNAGAFTGRVTGGQLVFDRGVAPVRRPSTRDVFFCDGALAAPNDGITGPVAAILGAAFNRSTLRDQPTQPTTDPAGFYRHPVSNHYAKALHDNTVDGKAYGFAFDDVVDFASYVQDLAPTAFTVTLTPFGA